MWVCQRQWRLLLESLRESLSVPPFTRAFLKSPSSRGVSAIAELHVLFYCKWPNRLTNTNWVWSVRSPRLRSFPVWIVWHRATVACPDPFVLSVVSSMDPCTGVHVCRAALRQHRTSSAHDLCQSRTVNNAPRLARSVVYAQHAAFDTTTQYAYANSLVITGTKVCASMTTSEYCSVSVTNSPMSWKKFTEKLICMV